MPPEAHELHIFDCEGTITNSVEQAKALAEAVIQELDQQSISHSNPPESAYFTRELCYDIDSPMDYIQQLHTILGLDPKTLSIPDFAKLVLAVHSKIPHTPNPGIGDYLEQIHQKDHQVAIASNTSPKIITRAIAELGLEEFFNDNNIFTTSDPSLKKPSPHLFEAAMKAANQAAEGTYVYEDSPHGITAATKAGIQEIIGVCSSQFHSAQELTTAGSTKTITDFTELIK